MSLRGKGALGVWHGVAEGHEREIEDWYNREHHDERVTIRGFLRARRYVNLEAGPQVLSRYDVTESAVLASEPYLAALNNPSPVAQGIFPHYRNTVRGAFRVVARTGGMDGGFLTTLRFAERSGEAAERLEQHLIHAAGRLVRMHGILTVEAWRVDADVTTHRSREKELRANTSEPYPGFALMVEASGADHAMPALAAALPADVIGEATTGRYQLVYQQVANAV